MFKKILKNIKKNVYIVSRMLYDYSRTQKIGVEMKREIAKVRIKNKNFQVVTTQHAIERMNQRNIDEYVIAGNIIALGEHLIKLANHNEEAIVIDEITNTATVIGAHSNGMIFVITVINKSNVFVKNKTKIFRLKKKEV
jgi:hypothetical protein